MHTHEQRHRAAQQEIKRRTRVVGTFPDGKSALMLVAARLKYVADSEWGSRRYLDAALLKEQPYRRLPKSAQNYLTVPSFRSPEPFPKRS